jgi:hypothetical protein
MPRCRRSAIATARRGCGTGDQIIEIAAGISGPNLLDDHSLAANSSEGED